MKPADYYRDLANRIGDARDREGRLIANDVASSLRDAAGILSDMADRTKARAERIQWIETTSGPWVARIGKYTAEYSGNRRRAVVYGADLNVVARFEATSIESANRKIRAWRKKQ